jgi:hypothetical protein
VVFALVAGGTFKLLGMSAALECALMSTTAGTFFVGLSGIAVHHAVSSQRATARFTGFAASVVIGVLTMNLTDCFAAALVKALRYGASAGFYIGI